MTIKDRYRALLTYGLPVTAQDSAIYYESADQGGSGRHGTANNQYTAALYIAGFALVEHDTGRLIMSQCYHRDDVPTGHLAPSELCERDGLETDLWIATATDGFTTGAVGWFRASDLSPSIPEPDIAEPDIPEHDIPDDVTEPTATEDIYYYRNSSRIINDGYVEDIP